MDSHFQQVMTARARLAGSAPRRYFAYSTVLDAAAFDEWRRQHGYDLFTLPPGRIAEGLELALVFDFPSRWWDGRVAGLGDRQGATVFGRLFEIAGEDWPIVQHKEGAITGMSVERSVRVRVDGEISEATAFTTNPARARQDGPISRRFVDALLRGAEAGGLPAVWLEQIRAAAR